MAIQFKLGVVDYSSITNSLLQELSNEQKRRSQMAKDISNQSRQYLESYNPDKLDDQDKQGFYDLRDKVQQSSLQYSNAVATGKKSSEISKFKDEKDRAVNEWKNYVGTALEVKAARAQLAPALKDLNKPSFYGDVELINKTYSNIVRPVGEIIKANKDKTDTDEGYINYKLPYLTSIISKEPPPPDGERQSKVFIADAMDEKINFQQTGNLGIVVSATNKKLNIPKALDISERLISTDRRTQYWALKNYDAYEQRFNSGLLTLKDKEDAKYYYESIGEKWDEKKPIPSASALYALTLAPKSTGNQLKIVPPSNMFSGQRLSNLIAQGDLTKARTGLAQVQKAYQSIFNSVDAAESRILTENAKIIKDNAKLKLQKINNMIQILNSPNLTATQKNELKAQLNDVMALFTDTPAQ